MVDGLKVGISDLDLSLQSCIFPPAYKRVILIIHFSSLSHLKPTICHPLLTPLLYLGFQLPSNPLFNSGTQVPSLIQFPPSFSRVKGSQSSIQFILSLFQSQQRLRASDHWFTLKMYTMAWVWGWNQKLGMLCRSPIEWQSSAITTVSQGLH